MRAAVCDGYGGPEVLRLADLPDPEPGPGQVRVRVLAALVSAGDARVRGLDVPPVLRPMLRAAFGWRRPRGVLGTDLCGVVDRVGPGCTRLRPGDAVVAFPGTAMGAHAGFCLLPEAGRILARPAGLTDPEAASLFFGGTTALHFLRDRGGLRAGQRVLVLGGAGVVGSAAVQIAEAMGAEVTATARADHLELLRRLGARAVDRDADPGTGFALILDTTGALPPAALRARLAPGGLLCLVEAGPGRMLAALWHRDTQVGMAPERRADMEWLAHLARAGRYRPLIDSVFSLDRIAEAHARVGARGRAGGVVVTCTG
ncbi:MAG: zinc-binding alcohol dehydrogenase family protein [Gemmobacter sp.]